MSELNSYGMYDSPRHNAPREPLALTQKELQQQLEAGAFDMDKDEAIERGLVCPYDNETDIVLVTAEKEEAHESGS
jgi:hypothetical protein